MIYRIISAGYEEHTEVLLYHHREYSPEDFRALCALYSAQIYLESCINDYPAYSCIDMHTLADRLVRFAEFQKLTPERTFTVFSMGDPTSKAWFGGEDDDHTALTLRLQREGFTNEIYEELYEKQVTDFSEWADDLEGDDWVAAQQGFTAGLAFRLGELLGKRIPVKLD